MLRLFRPARVPSAGGGGNHLAGPSRHRLLPTAPTASSSSAIQATRSDLARCFVSRRVPSARAYHNAALRPTAVSGRAQVLDRQRSDEDEVGEDADELEDAATTSPTASPSHGVKLRPYQEECIQDCLAAIDSGVTRIGVSSPTGSGKTTIFTHLIDRIPPRIRPSSSPSSSASSEAPADRVLVLVNSIELALQAAASIANTFPDKLVEIEQGAKFNASGFADVTVATVQTLHRSRQRLEKFNPASFKALIVDEAHHAAAPSYRDVLAHFDPSVANVKMGEDMELSRDQSADDVVGAPGKIPIVGFSATFTRHDGLALGKVFERIVFHKDFLEMIGEKWLCPIRFTSIKADIDLASVKLSSSNASADFQASSLAAVVNTPVVNRLVLRAWTERALGKRRSTLIFAVNIQHVEDLTATFCEAGIDARYLHGGTPMLERRQLLNDFRSGVFPVLVNCAILTEGADVPAIDCVLLARPTRSRNLFSQMIGRGLRLSPQTNKSDCLVLDIVGNIQKGVVCTPTLFGLDGDEMIEGETVKSLQERAELAGLDTEAELAAQQEDDEDALALDRSTTLTYIDYEDPFQLHKAMQARSRIVETMSQNAWVDCGAQTYILDVPRYGFMRVERIDEDGSDAESSEHSESRPQWISHFTPVNSDADEANAAMGGGGGGRPRRFGGGGFARSPYRRARKVLESADLESAIRGSDQYVQKQVLRGAAQLYMTLNRYAKWRGTRASESQRKLVEKRLGLSKVTASGGEGGAEGKESASRSALIVTDAMTKGQAAVILTRLMHGAKSRWQQRVKSSNKLWKQAEKERTRVERETVRIGPLAR